MINIVFRLLIIYIVLICSLRFLGKRQIGELEISELITTILLSELAAMPITYHDVPLLHAIIPILLLMTFEIIVSFLITRCAWLKKLFYERPSFLIRRGKLDQKEMSRVRLSLDEFISELRLKDISAPDQVNYAILEPNGKLSVFPKSAELPLTPAHMADEDPDPGIAHAIVIDGAVNMDALHQSTRNEKWLHDTLKAKKLTLNEIFLFAVDDSGAEILIKKEGVK